MDMQINRLGRGKRIGGIIILIVILVGIPLISYSYITRSNTAHEKKISQINKDHTAELFQKDAQFSDLSNDFDTIQAEFSDVNGRFSQLQVKHTALEEVNADLITDLAVANRYIRNLEGSVLCYRTHKSFNPDYSSHVNMAESLREWVNMKVSEMDNERVSYNSWDRVFNNSNLAIHYVHSSSYQWVFIVYLEEAGDYTNGVFWLSGQCWLDIQESEVVE